MSDHNNATTNSHDSDTSSTYDFAGDDTQVFDSQFHESPSSSFVHRCDTNNETQVMDPDGETQMMDLDGETQMEEVFDCGGMDETQLFDGYDTEEVLGGSDCDGSDHTEIVGDSDEEDCRTGECAGSADGVNTDCGTGECANSAEGVDTGCGTGECDKSADGVNTDCGTGECGNEADGVNTDGGTGGTGECANSADGECTENVRECGDCGTSGRRTCGIGLKTFTTIRAEAMRAAGLTAHNKALKRGNSPLCPMLISEPDIEDRRNILFENDNIEDVEKVSELNSGENSGNVCGFGRSTVRKLFDEDALAEIEEANDEFGLGGGVKSPILDDFELVGLSYVDSQEPGDASQANALDIVDNFLKDNIECDDVFDVRKSTGGKSKPELNAKGAQVFAKSVNLINMVDNRQAFCWDNNLEDEGGGEFYKKNKEVLFASGSRKLKSSVPSRSGKKLGQSDSKLVAGRSKDMDISKKSLGTVVKELNFQKNLIKDLDKQSTDIPNGMDIQGTNADRFDTQMAAEAMEDLCFGLQETDPTKTNAGCSNMQNVIHKSQHLPVSNGGVRTTQSKSRMSADQSKKVKRVNAAAKKSEKLDNVASDVGKRKRKMSLKRRESDRVDAPVASVDQMPVKKQRIQNTKPLARRTRQSINDNEPNKEINVLTEFYPKGKRTTRKLSSTRKEVGTQSISRLTRSKADILTEQGNGSIRGRCEQNHSVCMTPVSHATPVKEASPICMGDEYLKQSCRRPSLIQEVNGLFPVDSLSTPCKNIRQRRDVSLIRVVFSRHLDGDIIKQQKKILCRLGASESSSMSDATHFIADSFVRTRNMLEAIARGKPVVTHLWLESCGQARCHIDEKKFILRDAKKEKEFGFSMPSSLARASQDPLLNGHKVLITPNTKPGKEILTSLVKAVHGVAVERVGRSSLNDDKVPEGLLILSCEEDYEVCLPFLEKGTTIYSSELLLNGIVTQSLEYERHRLFSDHVKRTRSTIWLKKVDKQYKPVSKVK